MQASAGQHPPVLACIYLYLLVFALSLLSCGAKRSETERGCSELHYFPGVGASVAKQSDEATLNYMLESMRKFVDIVIRAPRHIINLNALPVPMLRQVCVDPF